MADKVLDLELSGPCELSPVSARYEHVRLLVRLRGTPLGYLHIENGLAELEPAAIKQRAADRLGSKIWEEVLQSRWAGPAAVRGGVAERPTISVVVCTRDRAFDLEGCLAALAEQEYPRYEVIVVDNAPRDRATREVADRFDVRYVVERRPGLDWARNCGLRAARGPIVAYTDDDARPDRRWLACIAAGFASPDVQAVTGLIAPAELETTAQILFEYVYGGMAKGVEPKLHSRRGWKASYTPNIYGSGCNMAFRKEALERLDGFDPALDAGTITGGGGDLDIFQRLIETDGVIAYRPDAIVRHLHRRSVRQLRHQLFNNGRAFSAVLWASVRRARGSDRFRALGGYWTWFRWWILPRFFRRLFRRGEEMPLRLILAEVWGLPLGPALYAIARQRARRLADSAIEQAGERAPAA